MTIKRYSFEGGRAGILDPGPYMVEAKDGEWIRYEDALFMASFALHLDEKKEDEQ